MLSPATNEIEFGCTAELATPLRGSSGGSICRWLSDDRRVASSIWREDLTTDLDEDGTYRLSLMSLNFSFLELKPTVDIKMWTDVESRTRPSGSVVNIPVFRLHSVGFDPNVSLPPGLGTVSADSLGIDIEVAGELRPAPNGRGLKGRIGFVTRGNLTPPMKILPEGVLRAAGSTVCRTVKDFAVRSFVDGATAQCESFRRSEDESSLR